MGRSHSGAVVPRKVSAGGGQEHHAALTRVAQIRTLAGRPNCARFCHRPPRFSGGLSAGPLSLSALAPSPHLPSSLTASLREKAPRKAFSRGVPGALFSPCWAVTDTARARGQA
ncbi:hypothetical protein MTO96_021103 [Rhipicephalus appendiculatus]